MAIASVRRKFPIRARFVRINFTLDNASESSRHRTENRSICAAELAGPENAILASSPLRFADGKELRVDHARRTRHYPTSPTDAPAPADTRVRLATDSELGRPEARRAAIRRLSRYLYTAWKGGKLPAITIVRQTWRRERSLRECVRTAVMRDGRFFMLLYRLGTLQSAVSEPEGQKGEFGLRVSAEVTSKRSYLASDARSAAATSSAVPVNLAAVTSPRLAPSRSARRMKASSLSI
ncbi:hypothetical protein EVAR_19056_1 [Eumeta japonica]|uniref:Uncharacterized protein n=1 Tax=Eumeta variegata TaxID=151549 RepID=A0A4C2A1U8_EUMVA|nr:hypothetical protein EVAR_19056_1 [Eumeta japonica]